jgi:hypothetical protein
MSNSSTYAIIEKRTIYVVVKHRLDYDVWWDAESFPTEGDAKRYIEDLVKAGNLLPEKETE